MRKARQQTVTKVWHNPEIQTFARRSEPAFPSRSNSAQKRQEPEGQRDGGRHRAALEALFSPRPDQKSSAPQNNEITGPSSRGGASAPKSERAQGRIVPSSQPVQADPLSEERKRLLSKLLVAEGRPKISKAAAEFLRAGFDFPVDQDVYLQLLEHSDDQYVRSAIDGLSALLAAEEPKRRAVLESRLRRIEEYAEEADTRKAADQLLRKLAGSRAAAAPATRAARDSEAQ